MIASYRRSCIGLVLIVACLAGCQGSRTRTTDRAKIAPAKAAAVEARIETLVLPTYPVGKPSDFPEFGRTTGLGRPGRGLYPYTVQRDLSFDRRDQGYETYVLQNEYLRIEVLPTQGGRLFAMYDRSAKQDVVYRQVSIKPGLVGLRGAWISGGIEWDFPRSHSVTTFDTVSCQFVRHDDGSASIVIGDTERTYRMSWTVELTLRPGRSQMETRIICRNPTAVPHDGYWWSNACFPANDQTQLIYPFNKVIGHDGGGASDWPIRDGKDLTWYRDYPASTSIFRAAGEEDFIAAYDHGRDIALAQFADHRVMPGRKWFSWGNSDSGLRWAKTLSDDNRPYVEVQSGCPLTQDDQFRMQPHEEKQFLEYWMPVSRIGPPARINPDAAVRLTVDKGIATVGVMPMYPIGLARIELTSAGRVLKQWQRDISPADVFKDTCALSGVSPDSLKLRVCDAAGNEVIAHQYGHYAPGKIEAQPRPDRFSTTRPSAPRVNPLDTASTQIAEGRFAQARDALIALAANPDKKADADAIHYYLGLAQARLGQSSEALQQWDAIKTPGLTRDAAILESAKVLLAEKNWRQALDRLASLTARSDNQAEAQAYSAFALRQLNRLDEARSMVLTATRHDPLMLLGQTESALLDGRSFDGLSALRDEERCIEAATIYMALKQYATAESLLRPTAGSALSPTGAYLRAYTMELMGNATEATRLRKEASKANVRGCLPSRLEELAALEAAIRADNKDATANYLAGLVLYTRNQREEGVAHWQTASTLGHKDAIVYRCLGGVLRDSKPTEAVLQYERAIALAPEAAEVYADLDAAYIVLGDTDKRVSVLERGLARLPDKDDLAHRLGVAYFDAGRYDEAVKCYQSYRFHVSEGQRDLHDHYATALVARAMTQLKAGRTAQALADLDASLEYPENLGIGRPDYPVNNAMTQYWRGVALASLNRTDEARKAWQESGPKQTQSRRRGGRMGYYSTESGLSSVYTILTLRKLGLTKDADDAAAQLESMCQRFEAMDDQASGYVALLRGFVAAANGQADQSAKLLKQARSDEPSLAGYVKLVGTWCELLAAPPATQTAAMPSGVR